MTDTYTTDAAWQPTIDGYILAGTDSNFSTWWQLAQLDGSTNLANSLGKSFGDHPNSFLCGIGLEETCPLPACSAYQRDNDDPWSYQALVSVVNLNAYMNNIYTGISNGQLTFSNEIDGILAIAAPKVKMNFPLGSAAFWIAAVIGTLFSFVPPLLPVGAVIRTGVAGGISAFSQAGIQQISYSVALNPATGANTFISSSEQLGNYTASFGQAARKELQQWANDTMAGRKDVNGTTILDYVKGGAYIDASQLPSLDSIERFVSINLWTRAVSAFWQQEQQKMWVMKMSTDDAQDASGPNMTRWYSEEEKAIYYTYRYVEDGHYKGHVDAPIGLSELIKSPYNLNGSDISKSSAGAFKIGGFNFTQQLFAQYLRDSILSNGTINPFEDGAGAAGVFSLPVCDIGKNNWNSQYGDKSTKTGLMPCCCGTDCKNTKAFVQAANMKGFQTLKKACEAQLQYTNIKFKNIDYGF